MKRLFWQAQIGAMRACPPLCGVVSSESLGAANSPKVWTKILLRLAGQAPRVLLLHVRDKWNRRVVLPRLSVTVTTRCTLNCEKCVGHMPYLKNHRDVPSDELVQDIQALLSCVDYIYAVLLSGGEVFLHPDLAEIIRACADPGKIGGICIITNGTVIPDAETLAALGEAKVTVLISKYAPELQPDVERLKSILKENGIHYLHECGTSWSDMGEFGGLKEGSAKRRFSVCVQQLCLICFSGKLHLCGQSALLMEEGLHPGNEDEYIDLRAVRPAEFRGQWEKLRRKRVISACSYCLGTTYQSPKAPVAVQHKSA